MTEGPLVLWDIDGTLLRSPGLGVNAFARAVQLATGVEWTPRRLDFGGRTDPDIASRVLHDAGVTDPDAVPLVLEALVVAYGELADELRASVQVMPGIDDTLRLLAERGACQTVVTGNIRPVAELKVEAAGLGHRLRLDFGGFGSDHIERAELVRLSVARSAAARSVHALDRIWVIGDTPRDLACARANGIGCVLVATGNCELGELEGLGGDLVLPDLADPTPLLELFDRRRPA